ncbi:hypothetical protein AGOR_G00146520 [Albula goreensis]|uniref:Peptidase S1 domain-containing protein n=1 Tax=Albula goreensis TaxID=1534307 RepID=A0A8T3DAS5_9TELE|nr:hypothetical protein AGOR_G00146520 [Albula goreensis]
MQSALSLLMLMALLPFLAFSAQQDSSIVNGRESKHHSRPYMVSVQTKNKHICGGFLVSKFFVMTAAHCFTWGETLTVLLGAHNILSDRKDRAEVKFYHIHPGFNDNTLENDIMLLQLKSEVKKTKIVQWIALPNKDKDTKPKTVCSVAGWGANKTNGSISPHLLEADVTVVDRSLCRKTWMGKPITPRMMCAGGNIDKRGFCQGDSGGPLMCKTTAVAVERRGLQTTAVIFCCGENQQVLLKMPQLEMESLTQTAPHYSRPSTELHNV